ncbi:hypothetical protein EX30DRAFT_295641, partial [Ascodesmis nigricans]
MSDADLFFSLLRISAAQILRAAGLTTAKPSVLDAFTDILRRYLILLGTTTRDMAELNNRIEPDISDVRKALEHVGLIRPINVFSDPEDGDTRGVEAFVEWFRGGQEREMRRVAGFAVEEAMGGVPAQTKNEEWLGMVRKVGEKR